jgi:hypothetical protein
MKTTILTATLFGSFVLFGTTSAFADSLSDCGNVNVEAEAECKVMAEGGCAVNSCTPITCSASLYADCKGECSLPDVDCELSCGGTCKAECEAKGGIDCKANCSVRCEGSCSGDCDAQCSADSDKTTCKAKCEGTCKASCKGECGAKCEVVKPEATCEAKCEGSCSGSCTVKKNLDCHMDCRAKGEASCTGGCEIACSKPDAAVFCDSQYIDHGGHFESCLNAIEATIEANVEFDAKADGSAACNNGKCEASGSAEASASCAMAKVPGGTSGLILGLFGAATAGLVLRGRKRRVG